MVVAAFVGAVLEVVNAVMPGEEVFGVGLGHKVWIRVFLDVFVLFVKTFSSNYK